MNILYHNTTIGNIYYLVLPVGKSVSIVSPRYTEDKKYITLMKITHFTHPFPLGIMIGIDSYSPRRHFRDEGTIYFE